MGRTLFVLFCVFVSGIQWSHPSARPRRRLVRAVSPKEVYDGGGAQGPQLSRLVSAVGAEEEGWEVTTCVAVISKDTSAVPSVSVCNSVACSVLFYTLQVSLLRHVRQVARWREKTKEAH